MNIPLMRPVDEYLSIREEMDSALSEFYESGKYILGPYVARFEEQIAEYVGTKYAVGVASGTDALLITLRALGVSDGDEVITTPFTFVASADVICRLGAKPVFVDVEPGTLNLNANLVEQAITERTRAILPVHLYGLPVDMIKLNAISKQYGIPVVEDACQALGAKYNGNMAGALGRAACFSFFPTKNLGCFGDGGIITTDDEALYEMSRVLRVHGAKTKNHPDIIGYKSRLDALQAVVLSVKLPYFEGWLERKREIVSQYRAAFVGNENIRLLKEPPPRRQAFHQFTIRVNHRDKLQARLSELGIASGVYYPAPIYETPAFAKSYAGKVDCPETEIACGDVLSLPLFVTMTQEQIDTVINAILDYY